MAKLHPLAARNLSTETYRNGRYLVFDLETTNFSYGDARDLRNSVVMVAWKSKTSPTRHFYGNILECGAFWSAVESADFLVAHNAKFEAHWLKRLGLDPTDYLWADTMLFEYVLAGNRFRRLALGEVATRYGFISKDKMIDTMMKIGICPSEMPKRRLIARCRRDTRTTELILRQQLVELHGSGRLSVALTRCLTTPILTQIETEGMCLDKERVHETYGRFCKQLSKSRSALDIATGGINPRSSDQLAEFLYGRLKFAEPRNKDGSTRRNKSSKRWPDGKPKTDKDTLLGLKARTKKQREYIKLQTEFGKLNAAVTKNLEFFKGVVDERLLGIFYGTIRQGVARTHRLTSNGVAQQFEQFPKPKSVQFHNMPRIFKRLFKARSDDYVIVEADGMQIEFRCGAFLGQDPQAMADILDPAFDAHKYTASVLNGIPVEEVSKELRQHAKADTYKPLYGGQKGTPEQERYYAQFQKRYRTLYEVQESWVNQVTSTQKRKTREGTLVTPWGLRFYWKFHMSGGGVALWVGKSIEPSVFNNPFIETHLLLENPVQG